MDAEVFGAQRSPARTGTRAGCDQSARAAVPNSAEHGPDPQSFGLPVVSLGDRVPGSWEPTTSHVGGAGGRFAGPLNDRTLRLDKQIGQRLCHLSTPGGGTAPVPTEQPTEQRPSSAGVSDPTQSPKADVTKPAPSIVYLHGLLQA
jgi:hypothetical protein